MSDDRGLWATAWRGNGCRKRTRDRFAVVSVTGIAGVAFPPRRDAFAIRHTTLFARRWWAPAMMLIPDKSGERTRICNTKVCVSATSYAVTFPEHHKNDPSRNRATDPKRATLPGTVSRSKTIPSVRYGHE
jgi:hypothetical protein